MTSLCFLCATDLRTFQFSVGCMIRQSLRSKLQSCIIADTHNFFKSEFCISDFVNVLSIFKDRCSKIERDLERWLGKDEIERKLRAIVNDKWVIKKISQSLNKTRLAQGELLHADIMREGVTMPGRICPRA